MAKRWLIFLLVLLLVPLAPIALMLRSESLVLDGLEWAVDNITDFDLQLVNPRIDVYAGTASADEVHLRQDTAYGPALVSIQGLAGTNLRWYDLLRGTLRSAALSANSVLIYLSERDEAGDPEPITWLSYLSWLPKQASINSFHLVNQGESVWIFPLRNVSGYRGDYTNFIASAEAASDADPLSLAVEVHALRQEHTFIGIEMTAELDAPDSGGHGTFIGELRGTDSDYEYDLQVVAYYPELEDLLDADEGVGKRLRGKLAIEGRLHGDTQAVSLQAERIILDNMPAYGIEASGTLYRDFGEDDVAVDVISAGEMASLEPLSSLTGIELSGFGRAQASARISGTLKRPQIDEFVLATRAENGLAVNASGRLSPTELANGDVLPDNEISVDISGPDLQPLEPWLGEIAIDPGPWFASAVVTGDARALTLRQLLLEAGTVGSLDVRAEGQIDTIDIASSPFTPEAVKGIDITARVASEDTERMGQLLRLDLPAYHRLDGYLEIRGQGDHLTASNGRLTVSSSDLELSLTDIAMQAVHDETFTLKDFRGSLSGELSDTSALSQYTDRPAISLGPVSARAELAQRGASVSAESLGITVSGEGFQVESQGRIDNLATLDGIALDQRFSGLNTRNVLATLFEDFVYPHELGNLAGSFKLRGKPGTLAVRELNLANSGSERLALAVTGSIENLDTLDADLVFRARASDTNLLEALTGLKMAAAEGAGTLKNQGNEVRLTGEMSVGRTRLSTDTTFSTGSGKLQSLDMQIAAPHLYLADLGMQARTEGERLYRPAEQIEEAAESGLERVLSRAPRFPSRVRLSIDELTGENTSIDSLHLELTGLDGAYTVRQFDANYAGGEAQVRGIVDLNQQPAAISLAGQGISIPLNRLSADMGAEVDIEGVVSFRGGLTGRGTDRDALLQSLDGSLAFALEDAVIEGAAYDVLATGILEWMYSGAALETSTRLDCTMARFDFDRGKARTDNIFIETRKMIATGEAMLDLVKGEIDLSLTPRSKSRQIHIPSTVRVKGPIAKPRTIVSPVSAAADAYAEALVLVPNLALKLFGIKRDARKRTRPCEAAIQEAVGSNAP